MQVKQRVNIFWFRRDLRINDNKGLYFALKAGVPVLPLFIFDNNILAGLDKSDRRVDFIYNRVRNLDEQLRKQGGGILVKKGDPVEIFRNLSEDYRVAGIYTNSDYEPYSIERDSKIKHLAIEINADFKEYNDHLIFVPGEIAKTDGKAYEVFTPFSKNWLSKLHPDKLEEYRTESYLDNLTKNPSESLITMEELGFTSSDFQFPSSEIPHALIQNYDKTRNYPAIEGTTRLGVHLRFGTVSVRECVIIALQLNKVWLNELIWREFFIHIMAFYPYVCDGPFKKQYTKIQWLNDETDFKKWCNGDTGYPLVDAGMRQLHAEGFIHNRVRMVCGSFLVKHLLIDWRWGEAWFAKHLLDFELGSNNGNWQWVAGCGCDSAPYFRIFNPELQQQKFDPRFEYIKMWVPEYGTITYTKPIIKNDIARLRCIKAYKEALA
jgi:deoxyribodipyrimidine photo-lyase